MNYGTTSEIELAIVNYFGNRTHVIVPNVSWAMFNYELDLCVLNNKSFYASEIEIKISRSDLKRDSKKRCCHNGRSWNGAMIRYLWFAMPEKMENCADLVPEHAGIMLVDAKGQVRIFRKAKTNITATKWTIEDAFKLARLGTLKMWNRTRK